VIVLRFEVTTDQDKDCKQNKESNDNRGNQTVGHDPEINGATGHKTWTVGGREGSSVAAKAPDLIPGSIEEARGVGENINFV